MKIFYDNVSKEYKYPLSKNDVTYLRNIVEQDIWERIRHVRFGCNTKTTQEGRIVQKGRFYDIRINFCLNGSRTLILSEQKEYLNNISKFGGRIELSERFVYWKEDDAKRYGIFLLLHEIGHIKYCESRLGGKMQGKTTNAEEQYCDNFAFEGLKKL